MNRLSRSAFRPSFKSILLVTVFITSKIFAQSTEVKKLKSLSIEELMNIEVTSVTKGPQKLTDVASAIQVITREDILRSGATSIPEALRLASNLQVAQYNANSWIISARGFNTIFANKLLVLIDGRTVYTPLFGGVLWDQQSVLLEDVDRIEIISGPGGTLWGANAVNGVINIITRRASQTDGVYASAAVGDFLKHQAAFRFGDSVNEKFSYRIYGQHTSRGYAYSADTANNDAWQIGQLGFRIDAYPQQKDYVTVQGDVYIGNKKTTPQKSPMDGQDLLARWTRQTGERSNFALQVYYDRYYRQDPTTLADELQTVDVDFQHSTKTGKHTILWGLNYRYVHDRVYNHTKGAGLVPEMRTMPLYSGFIQDQIQVSSKLNITIGSKFLDNVFSGFEYQPSLRASYSFTHRSTLWAAASKAIRAPSRFDVDYKLPLEPQPPNVPSVAGGPNFDSEKLYAYELGWRIQPNSRALISIATFFNHYNDVYSVEPLPGTFTYQIQNGSLAESWGTEFSGFYQILTGWRVRGGFTYFGHNIWAKEGHNHDPSYLANDAKHHLVFQSMLNVTDHLKFDVVARYLDYIPATLATAKVNEYFTFDARIAYTFNRLEISVVGQNLWSDRHSEFGVLKIPRSVYGRIVFRL